MCRCPLFAGFFVFCLQLVKHTAGARDGGARLDGELVDEDVTLDYGGGVEREDLLDGDVAVHTTYDVGVLAYDIAFDGTVFSDDKLAVKLDIAVETAVETEVALSDDVALDLCTVADGVDCCVFHF